MSKYNYPSVHDLKDLAMIYGDCDDYRLTVWNPVEQQRMTLVFCGSDKEQKTVNFVVNYEDEKYHAWKWKWTMFKIRIKSKFRKWFK